MKFKISVAIILLSTMTIIGLMRWALDRAVPTSVKAGGMPEARIKTNKARIPIVDDRSGTSTSPAHSSRHVRPQYNSEFETDEIAEDDAPALSDSSDNPEEHPPTSDDDVKIINEIASLSDKDLEAQSKELYNQLEEGDLLERLEDGELSDEEAEKAKELLERFALLGLETTRRKYMDIEPELKDPIYAHRESLKEIREFLADN